MLATLPAGNASSPSNERETRAFLQLSRRQDDWLASLRAQVPDESRRQLPLAGAGLWLVARDAADDRGAGGRPGRAATCR